MLRRLKPFMIENSKVPVFLSKFAPIDIWAISFGFWVWCRGNLSEVTKRHETIHFQQQLECLFVGQWILYGSWWLAGYIKFRLQNVRNPGRAAYYCSPFEMEAYSNELDETYLATRRRYSWVKYVGADCDDY